MANQKDLAPLMELLQMEEERWPSSGTDEVSEVNCFGGIGR